MPCCLQNAYIYYYGTPHEKQVFYYCTVCKYNTKYTLTHIHVSRKNAKIKPKFLPFPSVIFFKNFAHSLISAQQVQYPFFVKLYRREILALGEITSL
jgi:hypothetical protein